VYSIVSRCCCQSPTPPLNPPFRGTAPTARQSPELRRGESAVPTGGIGRAGLPVCIERILEVDELPLETGVFRDGTF